VVLDKKVGVAMNVVFLVNDVLKFNVDKKIKRILWIDESYNYCYCIELFTNKLIIESLKIQELIQLFEQNIVELLAEDPTFKLVIEDRINDKNKKLRDKAFEVISFIASSDNEPKVFGAQVRSKLVTEAMQKFNVGRTFVYKHLKRYWQSGGDKNSLIPNFEKCGNKGREKSSMDVKLGRPSYESLMKDARIGINVTKEIQRIFDIALNRYYRNSKEQTLTKTYELMLKDFFVETISINGESITKVIDKKKIPTFRQFQYYFYKVRDIDEEIKSRKGERHYNQNYRPLESNSTFESMGPGHRYQVDATIADVYLVSRVNRDWVIGRPVVYLAVDVFSRLVTGIHVALEGPSWNGISSLLYNCMEDKVEFCKRLGITIEHSEWPALGIPRNIEADRGELQGTVAETMISNLKITIENTPTGRPDLKGIVEQQFRIINTKIKKIMPGQVKKQFRERGEKHYALGAKLDIYEFTEIMIRAVLNRNKNFLEQYPITQEMINDGVKPIPIELWEWGIKNRSGNLRTVSKDGMKLGLMRREKATVTDKGIKFKSMLYYCDKGYQENWHSKARIKGTWSVDIAYDNRDISEIYIINHENNSFEVCTLKKENEIYLGRCIEEVEHLNQLKAIQKSEEQDNINQINYEMNTKNESIIKKAEEKFQESQDSDRKRIENIKGNRKEENKIHSKEKSLILNKSSDNNSDANQDKMLSHKKDRTSSRKVALELLLKRRQKEDGDVG